MENNSLKLKKKNTGKYIKKRFSKAKSDKS